MEYDIKNIRGQVPVSMGNGRNAWFWCYLRIINGTFECDVRVLKAQNSEIIAKKKNTPKKGCYCLAGINRKCLIKMFLPCICKSLGINFSILHELDLIKRY